MSNDWADRTLSGDKSRSEIIPGQPREPSKAGAVHSARTSGGLNANAGRPPAGANNLGRQMGTGRQCKEARGMTPPPGSPGQPGRRRGDPTGTIRRREIGGKGDGRGQRHILGGAVPFRAGRDTPRPEETETVAQTGGPGK